MANNNGINKFKVTDITSHRNGVSGRSFYSVRFSAELDGTFKPNMLAIVPMGFELNVPDVECYVIDMNAPTANFRGDTFSRQVFQACKKADEE